MNETTTDHEVNMELERLGRYLGTPDLDTTIYNAAHLLNTLYQYQRRGFELRLAKGDDVRRFRLPEGYIERE